MKGKTEKKLRVILTFPNRANQLTIFCPKIGFKCINTKIWNYPLMH
ncbi:hypothetical protein TUM4438_45690 [Shewanella sairae]|uniref:Uncharacterized protein n=1 Tax=Shewanella sairae TaxID=190310 RepID=A0ABQ4PRV5_9GAMM|nr:hypothetical protein TUM4438_45690 [Shewanella sairae]